MGKKEKGDEEDKGEEEDRRDKGIREQENASPCLPGPEGQEFCPPVQPFSPQVTAVYIVSNIAARNKDLKW